MMTQDIQELMEGLLNDEQTAEVLHRLSVSPEKLAAFRQHMALKGAMDRDSRVSDLKDEEDDAVWAGILGATGGVLTGGSAAGSSGWLMKGAAFLLTGLAGFIIGTSVDSDTAANPGSARSGTEQTARQQSLAADIAKPVQSVRIDTVYRTVIEPKIVYRDRVKRVYVNVPGSETIARNDNDVVNPSRNAQASSSVSPRGNEEADRSALPVGNEPSSQSGEHSNATLSDPVTISQTALAALSSIDANSVISPFRVTEEGVANAKVEDNDQDLALTNPDVLLRKNGNQRRDDNTDESGLPDSPAKPTSALKRNGWEAGYYERVGRITPAPTGLNNVDPNFGGRGVDLSYRMLDGLVGFGGRVLYGSFARVTLEKAVWYDLGVADTIIRPNLETVKGFGTELFVNGRLPVFTDDLALGAEFGLGISSTHYKIGVDLSLMYMITNRLGAQVGTGYSTYWYSTGNQRREILENNPNTGLTSDISDTYKGTMLEGRYGLLFKF